MKLTLKQINALRTKKNGFCGKVVEGLGMKYGKMPESGWVERLIGMEMSEAKYAELFSLRDAVKTRSLNRRSRNAIESKEENLPDTQMTCRSLADVAADADRGEGWVPWD